MEVKNTIKIPWSHDETTLLKTELSENITIENIAFNHKRSVNSIITKIKNICCKMYSAGLSIDLIMKKTRFTKNEVEEIIMLYDEKLLAKNNDNNNNNNNDNNNNNNNDSNDNNNNNNNDNNNNDNNNDNNSNNDDSNNSNDNGNENEDNKITNKQQQKVKIINIDETSNSDNKNALFCNNGKKYSQQECNMIIHELSENKTIEEIGLLHKRTTNGIYTKIIQMFKKIHMTEKKSILPKNVHLSRLGIDWDVDEQKKIVIEIKDGKTIDEIAIIHERHKFCIQQQINNICKGLNTQYNDINGLCSISNELLNNYFISIALMEESRRMELKNFENEKNNTNSKICNNNNNCNDKNCDDKNCNNRKFCNDKNCNDNNCNDNNCNDNNCNDNNCDDDNNNENKSITDKNEQELSNQGNPWTNKEDELLKQNLMQDKSMKEISQIHGRTISSISSRIRKKKFDLQSNNKTVSSSDNNTKTSQLSNNNFPIYNNLITEINDIKIEIKNMNGRIDMMMKYLEKNT